MWATSRPLGLFLEQQAQEGLSGILLKSESRTERQAQGEPSVLIRILALIAHDRYFFRLQHRAFWANRNCRSVSWQHNDQHLGLRSAFDFRQILCSVSWDKIV